MDEQKEKIMPSVSQKSEPKKGKLVLGKILAVAGVLLVLCIIIGGALLASHVINPSWNPFKQNPDKGIRDKVIQQGVFKK